MSGLRTKKFGSNPAIPVDSNRLATDVRRFVARRLEQKINVLSLAEWEKLSEEQRRQRNIEHDAMNRAAISAAAKKYAVAIEVVEEMLSPAPAPSYWLVEPSTPEQIEQIARIKLRANPQRPGAEDWRQAERFGRLAVACIGDGDVANAVKFGMEALRCALRAELLEGPAPIIKGLQTELVELPRKRGRMAKGISKESRKTPLRRGLEILVREGLTNDQIFTLLNDPDAIANRAAQGFPFEVNSADSSDIRTDGFIRWFATGSDSDNPTTQTVKYVNTLLSKIRKAAKLL